MKKANDLLKENRDNIEDFIVNDPKGKMLLDYYIQIYEKTLVKEHKTLRAQTNRLIEKINNITEVIATQQDISGGMNHTESLNIKKIINSALIIEQGSISRYGITIVKDFQSTPDISVQKAKFAHIIINLLKNAKESIVEKKAEDKKVNITIMQNATDVIVKISDTGNGIKKENLNKIFEHGFTTKENGHGFGLHSSFKYMTEMNGKIWVESDGTGHGATFSLSLPIDPYAKSDS